MPPDNFKTDTNSPTGIVLIQIDGLSRFQFERAIHSGRMPHLKKLLKAGGYNLHSFYPGQPSCTPAVQAELHYGALCATPAFSFFDRATGQNVRMYDSEWAKRIAQESKSQGSGLLEGGSSYANIYTGGAQKAKYCGELNTFAHWSSELSILRLLKLALRNPAACFRLLKLLGIEIGIGLYDAIRGIVSRGDLAAELTFVPARLAVAIALREAIRGEVLDDIKAGLPIIHANFFGYDEAAHRRGPHSGFAHWTLKGLDQSIRKIYKAANQAKERNYRVIVFSDHGQEYTLPYSELANCSIAEGIEKILPDGFRLSPTSTVDAFMERSRAFIIDSTTHSTSSDETTKWVHLQAMGPVAHLYVDGELAEHERLSWAKTCCAKAAIPIALFAGNKGSVRCVTKDKVGDLSILQNLLRERGHEFVEETIEDLSVLVKSKYAGDLVLFGWRSGDKPLTFADERGAHAGPGAQECRGFTMLPETLQWDRPSLRPRDLRNIALADLGRLPKEKPEPKIAPKVLPKPEAIRVASYNLHGGVGIDRRIDENRMARALRQIDADVYCFQEAFEKANGPSLKQVIGRVLGTDFEYLFCPLHNIGPMQYGLAVASKLPLNPRKSEAFALSDGRFSHREPRGSIWAQISVPGSRPLNVLNTHFGLNGAERLAQAECLLSEDWLGSLAKEDLVILCGDFNTGPRGPAYLAFADKLSDTQLNANHGQSSATFLSWAPLRRIDHIFASPQLKVPASGVLSSRRIRNASDHLPVYADLELA
ncbi:endonuclease/exonuclease/phosphatase family protein [Pelagicoccus sp. SDUM812002]|uniref:endonuclease/exonuclease/phosphatase family protein n=1 Tax=Pelagicoccus sp. SDUM812002 TaxID=3041266 RepID=UPI00280D5353|nr:endonuclease/exonuclease/phosphatase family protein [Pelagicoccus sp. SDUM812002]MDQ8187396.1 endonuclease/exonuclease/phosphatase family protein [Pelagicoccus sp. SDUM812002]